MTTDCMAEYEATAQLRANARPKRGRREAVIRSSLLIGEHPTGKFPGSSWDKYII